MSLLNLVWIVMGLFVGGLHSATLWFAAKQLSGSIAATGALRLLVVALVLVGAARAGALLPACTGWFSGFLASVSYVLIWRRTA